MSDTVIKVEGVSKKYCRSLKHTMLYGVADLSRSFLGLDQQTERLRDGEFWAVNDVSFEVKKGETLGLIGLNGSGKSTLLKMLNGIMMPDKGRIEISGRVGALIEVGAGFHPMLTGRENIYINGAIIGMTKKEIDRKFDEIVDFAGIDNFIDSPVKHYSSGMYVRLGFAIAAHADPDVLLVDEVLAVGDADFQLKCLNKIEGFRRRGKNVVIVSHDVLVINKLCSKVVLLDHGTVVCDSNTSETVGKYFDISAEKTASKTYKDKGDVPDIYNQIPKKIYFTSVKLCDDSGKETEIFNVGQTIFVKASLNTDVKIDNPVFGGIVYSEDGIYLGGFNSLSMNGSLSSCEKSCNIEYKISNNLLKGVYFLTLAIHDETGKIVYDYHDRSYRFIVKADVTSLPYSGYFKIPCTCQYESVQRLAK